MAKKVRVLEAEMSNHDFLWFSSFEIGKTSTTSTLLHNYALTYAVNGFSYGFFSGCVPRYSEDLDQMSSYATAALPRRQLECTRFTQNAINSVTLRTEAPSGKNSPALGWRIVLNPSIESEELFRFYLFAEEQFVPPSVVRLGKKGCPIRIKWTQLANMNPVYSKTPIVPSHAVNPLDITGKVLSCTPVSIPPHLIFGQAEIAEDWFILSDSHRVHIPTRVLKLMGHDS